MDYRVTLETTIEPLPENPDAEATIVSFVEHVLDLLEDLGGRDADAGGSLATGELHVSVVIDAVDPQHAFVAGAQLIQRVVEKAGMKAEDWTRERFVVEPEAEPAPLAFA